MVLATLNHRVEPILSAWFIYWCWNQNFSFLTWLTIFRVGKLGCSFLCVPCMVLATNHRVEPVLLVLMVICLFNALISFIYFADVHILNIKNWAVRFSLLLVQLYSLCCLLSFFDAYVFVLFFWWGGGGGEVCVCVCVCVWGGVWIVYIVYCNL